MAKAKSNETPRTGTGTPDIIFAKKKAPKMNCGAVERLQKPSEASLERYAKKQVEARGGLYLKFVSPGFTGVPDRICIKPDGGMFFVEHKAPGGKLSERQRSVIEKLDYLGVKVYVVSVKETIELVLRTEFE